MLGRSLAAVLTVVLVGCRAAPNEKGEKPVATPASARGIVLVTVDGWWDPRTDGDSIPAQLIANEVRLTNAMTTSPQLRPAICSILTGKSPPETGVRNDVTTPLPESVPLVPRALAERGWRTAAFVADPRVGIGSGLERGFEVFDPPKEVLFGSFRRIPRVRTPDEVVADFATWLASVPESASFFAWVQISRSSADPEAGDGAAGVRSALGKLGTLIASTPRLANAAVALAGTAGRVDEGDGERSGYFLNAGVLGVPVILRSGGGEGRRADAASPFSLVELASWITDEAGMAATPGETRPAGTPLIAWTWRGRDEFGWPAEVAAQLGTALCIHTVAGDDDRCEPWGGSALADFDRQACLSALARQPTTWADPAAVPSLPRELVDRLDRLGLRARPGSQPATRSVSHDARAQVLGAVVAARRIEDDRKGAAADAEYQKALARDSKNFGVLIEAGEALALSGLAKPARARLDRAIQLAPSHPEAWHWLGHVAYLEKQLDRADAQWQVSEVLRSANGDLLYDLACSRSIMGRVAESDAYLRKAWAAGFRDVNKIQIDSDLRNLRADPAFLRFMREVVH